jgi:hypothetical protein
MKVINLQDAIEEAERFLVSAKNVPTKITELTGYRKGVTLNEVVSGYAAAACKRASMDLTRALAKLRQER